MAATAYTNNGYKNITKYESIKSMISNWKLKVDRKLRIQEDETLASQKNKQKMQHAGNA